MLIVVILCIRVYNNDGKWYLEYNFFASPCAGLFQKEFIVYRYRIGLSYLLTKEIRKNDRSDASSILFFFFSSLIFRYIIII